MTMSYGAECLGLRRTDAGPPRGEDGGAPGGPGPGPGGGAGCCRGGWWGRLGGAVFVATATTQLVAGGVSLGTPALAAHIATVFNATQFQAGA